MATTSSQQDDSKIVSITDSILAEDLKDLLNLNPDVKCEPEVKEQIFKFQDGDLLQYTKELGSIKITKVEKVDEGELEKRLSK